MDKRSKTLMMMLSGSNPSKEGKKQNSKEVKNKNSKKGKKQNDKC